MIRINRSITLLLPFHRYTLKLTHRLLNSLGGVSRFILRAVDDGLTFLQLTEVTRLSPDAMLYQLNFLEQHYFLKVDRNSEPFVIRLSERGKQMVKVGRRLIGFEPEVWLDGFTLKRHEIHVLLTNDSSDFFQGPIDFTHPEDTVVCMPDRPRRYHHFEDASRLRTILNQEALADLLAYYWSDDVQMVSDEMEHWEYSLINQDRKLSPNFLSVNYHSDEFGLDVYKHSETSRPSLPMLLLPVLEIIQIFSDVKGLPWSVTVPQPATLFWEMVSPAALPEFVLDKTTDASHRTAGIIPGTKDKKLPVDLQGIAVPPGLSVNVNIKHHNVCCLIDHEALKLQMSKCENVRLFSFKYRETGPV